MASLNIFGKPQKPAKEEEYDSSYYSTEEEYTAAPEVEEKPVYDNKPTAPQRTAYSAPQSAPVQMKLIRPSNFVDGQTIANCLMNNHPVLMHLENTTKEVSHDLVCFLTGVVYAIGGQIQAVSSSTYMLSPNSMEISEEELESDAPAENTAPDSYGYNGFNGFGGYSY